MTAKAVVLLSGGLDSAVTLALVQAGGADAHALTFDYGQRHVAEITAAQAIAQARNVARHVVLPIDLRVFGGSALTDDIAVPKNRGEDDIGAGIPITYVPARNTIFLSFALAWAEVLGAHDIFIGVNALDYSGYPDCRPEYIAAFETMARLATKAGVEAGIEGEGEIAIRAPLIHMTKAEIIAKGGELGVDFAQTRSCYDPGPGGEACGACDSCKLRLRGFAENGLKDPAPYMQPQPAAP